MEVLALFAQQVAASSPMNPERPAGPLAIMQAASHPLPGWSPIEKSIHFGWKGYRPGWYGHDARSPNASMLARMNVERGVALVISCVGFAGNDPAYLALSSVFGDWFPELTRIDAPRPLDALSAQRLDLGAFTGTYRTRATSIVVTQQQGALFLRREDQVGEGHRYRGAQDDLFLIASAAPGAFPYVQFIRPATDRPQYLWNGQNVWRRCA
jgi:hypothetical protein